MNVTKNINGGPIRIISEYDFKLCTFNSSYLPQFNYRESSCCSRQFENWI